MGKEGPHAKGAPAGTRTSMLFDEKVRPGAFPTGLSMPVLTDVYAHLGILDQRCARYETVLLCGCWKAGARNNNSNHAGRLQCRRDEQQ
jgi:hypothetical protein